MPTNCECEWDGPPLPDNEGRHFYKYRDAAVSKLILQNGTMRWSTPAGLNDPFDMQFQPLLPTAFSFGSIRERSLGVAWETFCRGGIPIGPTTPMHECLVKLKRGNPEINESDFRKKVGAAMETFYNSVTSSFPDLLSRIGPQMSATRILSLSVKEDVPTMWSHYAENHTGVVLRFRAAPNSSFALAHPMEYCDQVPYFLTEDEIEAFLSGASGLNILPAYRRLMYTKSAHWAYEAEWRVVSMVNVVEEMATDDRPFDPAHLDGVIFGLRTSKNDQEEIRDLASKYPNVQFFRAVREQSSYDLSIASL